MSYFHVSIPERYAPSGSKVVNTNLRWCISSKKIIMTVENMIVIRSVWVIVKIFPNK